MCGFGSDGAAAIPSACSFVRCCSHQFVFPSLNIILKLSFALKITRSAVAPPVRVSHPGKAWHRVVYGLFTLTDSERVPGTLLQVYFTGSLQLIASAVKLNYNIESDKAPKTQAQASGLVFFFFFQLI